MVNEASVLSAGRGDTIDADECLCWPPSLFCDERGGPSLTRRGPLVPLGAGVV